MKDEFFGLFLMAVLGFFIGGLLGHFFNSGWSPSCWYGVAAALGIFIIPNICD